MLRRVICVLSLGGSLWSDLDLGAILVPVRGHWCTEERACPTFPEQGGGAVGLPALFCLWTRCQWEGPASALFPWAGCREQVVPQVKVTRQGEGSCHHGWVREGAGWTSLMEPLTCKYFYVLNGKVPQACLSNAPWAGTFIQDSLAIWQTFSVVTRSKSLVGKFGFEYELDFIIVCDYF